MMNKQNIKLHSPHLPKPISVVTLSLIFLVAACAHQPNAPIVNGHDGSVLTKPSEEVSTSDLRGKGGEIFADAYTFLGTPYRYGGADPTGFDCSGLVYYTHAKAGIHIPRTSSAQSKAAKSLSRSELQLGDLIFFRINKSKISHVGIYAGNGKFIHAPSPGKRVSIERLDKPYWQTRLANYGRFY